MPLYPKLESISTEESAAVNPLKSENIPTMDAITLEIAEKNDF